MMARYSAAITLTALVLAAAAHVPGTALAQNTKRLNAASACDTYAANALDQQRRGPGVPFDRLDPQLAVPACEAAVRQFPDDVRLHYELGRAYQKAKNFAAAIEQYRKAAAAGFALAENNLGILYETGQGVPKDPEQAVAWYRKAADQGLAGAQNQLGLMYQNGWGVAVDFAQATDWFRKAAEQGFAPAQSNLAQLAKRVNDLANMSAAEIKALQQRLAAAGCYRGEIDGQTSSSLQASISTCPSQDPVLCIETGMHVVTISGIAVDRACRIAATGSADKTVRVWSLPDGRLLHTLRVPIGPGNGGAIRTTAVSPDGRWIAAGGWDVQADTIHGNYVYVFDASSGAMIARVGPFGDVVSRLTFSLDGHWLAATGAAGAGLKVIDAQTWRIAAEDKNYADFTFGVAFAPDGRLYTASDGKLRQYGPAPDFRKEREIATKGGKVPNSVAIDPRGQLVAVGLFDSTKIDFYDASTLEFRFNADVTGVHDSVLSGVAWSKDGEHLVVDGKFQILSRDGDLKTPLLTFDRNGRRIGGASPLGDMIIGDLQPCGDAMAVTKGFADPAFGLVEGNGSIGLWKTGVAPDMRDKLSEAFTIAPDAKQIRIGLGDGAEDPVVFDLGQAAVTTPNAVSGFNAPVIEGLPISNWLNNKRSQHYNVPTFAGKPIPLEPYEQSLSLAIRADRTGFVLGTGFWLRAFDAQGRQLWTQGGGRISYGVNLSSDGRIVVVACDDGTIRWHRWSDGKELLALFINRKTKAWVAWTPTGYYMASPGGEDLIGWHLNRGWNQAADFFPASRFRERFNRPDIVQLVLATLDEDAAIKQANEIARRREDTRPLIDHLPPIIRIAAPSIDAHVQNGAVTLEYVLRSPSGKPVEGIDLLINGRPVKSFGLPIKSLSPDAESTGSIPVTLTQHVSEVGLIARSGDLASQAVQMEVTWDGAPEVTRKLHALVVGVSDYADPAMALKYAAKDADDFAKALQDQKGLYYADVETRVLTDRAVTRASVIEGLEWLEKMATDPNDVSVLFIAGHGTTDEKQTYWFYTADANDDTLRINGVSQDELRKSLQGLQGKVLWFLDTCHAGTAAKRRPVDVNVLVNTVSASENGGVVVFASSTGRQASVESGDLGNGAFTKAVIEGIALGKAVRPDGFITTSSLDTYLEYRVGQFTDNKQTPVMERPPEEPDFAIAEMRK